MAQTQADTGKKKNSSKSNRVNSLTNIIVDKLDGGVMRAFVAENELDGEIDTDVSDEQLAVALSVYFKAKVSPEDQVLCEECKGVSDASLDACPFCGDTGEVDEGDVEVAAPSESDVSVVDADDEVEEIEVQAEVEPAPEPAKSKKTKAAKPAKEEPKMTTTTHTNGATNGAAKKGLAKTSATGLSTKDLDRAISEVSTLRTAGVVAYWELGKKILEINEKGLWKLRVEGGKARYKSFEAFVHAELSMSPMHAYNAMECAQGYESADAIREIGSSSKAVLLLKAAPQDREKLTEKVKAGATQRELAKDVAESRKKHGSPKKDSKHAKMGQKGAKAKAEKKAAAAPPLEKVSVTSIEGTKQIKLYKRPASMRGAIDLSTLPRAKSLGDQPFGRYELTNGVVQYFFIGKKEDGTLVLKIQTTREETSG